MARRSLSRRVRELEARVAELEGDRRVPTQFQGPPLTPDSLRAAYEHMRGQMVRLICLRVHPTISGEGIELGQAMGLRALVRIEEAPELEPYGWELVPFAQER